ncbi:MAG: PQQ-binding-like beta-propeller repeat protein [Candidatus Sumerlaeota bacterium]|nr:PQQ-binding-like beta-propeller repeat protein [Candidatus Sumerlaeota bacterium]
MSSNLPIYSKGGLVFISLAFAAATAAAQGVPDWPQFHGPLQNNISPDKNLLKRWPEGGPRLIWETRDIGEGYATVAIAGGRIYTAGNIGADTVITAMDLSGKILWQSKNGPAYKRAEPGARATPTIAGGKLYHLNGDGDVICLDAKTGAKIWALNMLEKFDGRNIQWGLSESLLVDGARVYCCPGGEKVMMAALNKDTGETIWTCVGVGDKPGYAAAIMVDYKGLRQIITMTSAEAISVAAETGKLLWRYDYPAPYDVNASSPIYHDGRVALFSTWGRGATMLKLNVEGEGVNARCAAEQVWYTKELDNEHGGVVLLDGYLYGLADGNHQKRHWACLEWNTGKTMYSVDGLPASRSATLTLADGMLYLMSDRGTVALAPADPKGLDIVSRFDLPKKGKGPAWAHLVILGGRLYIRHGNFLYCHDVGNK